MTMASDNPSAGRGGNLVRLLQPGADLGVGPFRITAENGLTPADPEVPVSFEIDWRGRPVAARLEKGVLHLRAILGRVPSTAAGGTPLRAAVFDILERLPAELPAPWTLRLLPDHRVEVAGSEPMSPPMSVAGLVCSLTEFLLALAPYLDLMEESGVTLLPLAEASVGTANS